MGNTNKETNSRRWFLSLFTGTDKQKSKPEMVKMLTAEGKLVEVEKSVYEKAATKQKSTNKEIYNWMKNPSKDKS